MKTSKHFKVKLTLNKSSQKLFFVQFTVFFQSVALPIVVHSWYRSRIAWFRDRHRKKLGTHDFWFNSVHGVCFFCNIQRIGFQKFFTPFQHVFHPTQLVLRFAKRIGRIFFLCGQTIFPVCLSELGQFQWGAVTKWETKRPHTDTHREREKVKRWITKKK